jgi:hypothetical protein
MDCVLFKSNAILPMIKRKLQTVLERWKGDSHRKPLVLWGALRFNTDYPSIVDVSTNINNIGKAEYKLLSLPLYLTGQVYRLLDSSSK